jgi:hypothetical protein
MRVDLWVFMRTLAEVETGTIQSAPDDDDDDLMLADSNQVYALAGTVELTVLPHEGDVVEIHLPDEAHPEDELAIISTTVQSITVHVWPKDPERSAATPVCLYCSPLTEDDQQDAIAAFGKDEA